LNMWATVLPAVIRLTTMKWASAENAAMSFIGAAAAAGAPPNMNVMFARATMKTISPFQKRKTYRSAKYLAWIRSRPCVSTGGPARAAHQNLGKGHMGGKASDIQALPLSDDAHNMGGQSEHRGQVTFWSNVFHLSEDDFGSWALFREHVEGCKARLILEYINEYLETGGKL
jgi:hypothetical protein